MEWVKNRVGGGGFDPRQLKETISMVERLNSSVQEGLASLCGVEEQVKYHSQVVDMLDNEIAGLVGIDPEKCAYSPQELFRIEACLVDLNEILKRLNPAAHTDFGVLLKEIRLLISIGYEREKLVEAMVRLINVLHDTPAFMVMNENKMAELKFTDPQVIRMKMKLDETKLLALLKEKCEELKGKAPDTIITCNSALTMIETATKIMSAMDALDVDEVIEFDKIIRRKVLEDECNIPTSALDFDDVSLGEGVFGIVDAASYNYKLKKERIRKKIAVKTLRIEHEILKDEYVELSNELQRWRLIDSPHIIKCFGMSLRENHCHLIFERPGKPLFKFLHENGRVLDKKELQKVARDVSLGLLQLHTLNVIHMNLSAQNILLTEEGLGGTMKISDFGSGLFHYGFQTRGPSVYVPPEVLSAKPDGVSGWSTKGDIYALGLILWECAQESVIPFGDKKYDLFEFVGKDKNSVDFKTGTYDKWMKEMIRSCVDVDPAVRPNAKDIAEMIFAKGHKDHKANMRTELKKVQNSEKTLRPFEKGSSGRKNTDSSRGRNHSPSVIDVVGDNVNVNMRTTNVSKSPPPGLIAEAAAPSPEPMKKADGSFKPRPPPPKPKLVKANQEAKPVKAAPVKPNYDEDDEDEYEELERNRGKRKQEEKAREAEQEFVVPEEMSFGPNEVEAQKAKRRGKMIQCFVESTKAKNKLAKRIRRLGESAMDTDRLEFSGLYSRMKMQRKLGDFDCMVIGLVAKYNQRLVRIVLEFNKFGNQGIDYLAEGVGHHPSLLQLYLGGNKNVTSVDKLMKYLQGNKVLEVLGLDGCSLNTHAANEIAEFFRKNTTLIQLDISENEIGTEGMSKIADALEHNTEAQLKSIIVKGQDASATQGIKKLRKVAKNRFKMNHDLYS